MPMYWLRVLGGTLYLAGGVLCGVNCLKTWAARPAEYKEEVHEAPPLSRDYAEPPRPESRYKGAPVSDMAHGIDIWMQGWWHRRWERRPFRFTVWVTIAVIVASLFEIIPTFLIRSNVPTIASVNALYATWSWRAATSTFRRLLQLPLADDSPDLVGNQTLRRIQQAGRVRLRPSVPMGIAAHRPRPGS